VPCEFIEGIIAPADDVEIYALMVVALQGYDEYRRIYAPKTAVG
jgi:hypothetical protein